jgi:hypothetical protein
MPGPKRWVSRGWRRQTLLGLMVIGSTSSGYPSRWDQRVWAEVTAAVTAAVAALTVAVAAAAAAAAVTAA